MRGCWKPSTDGKNSLYSSLVCCAVLFKKLKDEDENMKVMKQNILHAVDMLIAHASAKEDAANKELKGNMSSILEDTMQLLGDRDAAFRSR